MAKGSARGAAWEAQRLRVLNRDNWTCVVCGKHLEGRDATVDHRDPISLNPGATYLDSDLQSMCRYHNGIKSDQVAVRLPYMSLDWFSDEERIRVLSA